MTGQAPRERSPNTATTAGDGAWLRLDPRTIWASTAVVAGGLIAVALPLTIGLVISGVSTGWIILWTVGGVLLGSAGTAMGEWIRVHITRYRIDDHRIERKVELWGSSHTALAAERVRTIEISADLVQRWFGIAGLRLASGETDGVRFQLVALDRQTAERLRTRLLKTRGSPDTEQLTAWRPGWVRYAPVSILTPTLGVLGYGVVLQVADWFNLVPAMLDSVWETVSGIPWPALVAIGVLAGILVGAFATIVVFIESWWKYELERHSDGSLELRRGLLVGRHTSFDGRRIRGVTLHEPPGLRALRAARLDIIAVGVTSNDEQGGQRQSPALVPGAPREVPTGVGAAILGAAWPHALRRHPRAALRRRLSRAGLVTLGIVVLAALPSVLWSVPWWIPPAVTVAAALLSGWIGVDNARGLGHSCTRSHVVVRKGSLLRRTDVLNQDGLLGWNVRRSPLQRRAGLATLVATSAGGSGAFRLPDVSVDQAIDLLPTAGTVWAHLAVSRAD